MPWCITVHQKRSEWALPAPKSFSWSCLYDWILELAVPARMQARCSILNFSGRESTNSITRHISLRPSKVDLGLMQLSQQPQLSTW